jgi:hypothetical protein
LPLRRRPGVLMPWESVTTNSEVLAIHAALLHTRGILYFGGDEHNQAQNQSGNPADIDNTRLYETFSGYITTIGSPATDVFCSGHALLPEGRLLVAGGTDTWPSQTPPHHGGRWYPTLITLADGEVLAIFGHPHGSDTRHRNNTPERFSNDTLSWRRLKAMPEAEAIDYATMELNYPRVHVIASGIHAGGVFFATPVGSNRIYDVDQEQFLSSPVITPRTSTDPECCCAVESNR